MLTSSHLESLHQQWGIPSPDGLRVPEHRASYWQHDSSSRKGSSYGCGLHFQASQPCSILLSNDEMTVLTVFRSEGCKGGPMCWISSLGNGNEEGEERERRGRGSGSQPANENDKPFPPCPLRYSESRILDQLMYKAGGICRHHSTSTSPCLTHTLLIHFSLVEIDWIMSLSVERS